MAGDNSSDSEPTANTFNMKKRKREPEKHKRNIIRDSKVKGVQYKNWKGDFVEERKTGPDCKCRMKCFSKFEMQEKQDVL